MRHHLLTVINIIIAVLVGIVVVVMLFDGG